jgi:D-alanyl-D-alanine carboxypeptidase/D-alanyl-D-alanine-endopeptidase (penicillin-binding protein 4)
MLGRSDNDLAEAFARHVALATGKPATFAGGAAAIRDTLAKYRVDGLDMVDASGLSRSDRVQPATLVRLVDLIVKTKEFAPILQALPVAGFSGTLAGRYTTAPATAAAGVVRAKTGTLDGVVALAGYLDDASGRVLTFAVVVNGVPQGGIDRTEAAVDRLTTALAGCGCG